MRYLKDWNNPWTLESLDITIPVSPPLLFVHSLLLAWVKKLNKNTQRAQYTLKFLNLEAHSIPEGSLQAGVWGYLETACTGQIAIECKSKYILIIHSKKKKIQRLPGIGSWIWNETRRIPGKVCKTFNAAFTPKHWQGLCPLSYPPGADGKLRHIQTLNMVFSAARRFSEKDTSA